MSLSTKGFWALVTGAAVAFAIVAGQSYSLGRTYEEGLGNGKLADIKGVAEQAQARLVATQEKNAQLVDANTKFSQQNGQLIEILKAKNDQIERLAAQVGSVNNCAFLQEQIRTLEREASNIGAFTMFGAPEPEEKQQARRTSLT